MRNLKIKRFWSATTTRGIINAISKPKTNASSHVNAFRSIIASPYVITNDDVISKYTVDWTKNYQGGSVVCLPKSTEEVSKILQYCHEHNIGVVVQGGNTGLVGGGVGVGKYQQTTNCSSGVNGELIMNMGRMNKIIHIDPSAAVLVCEAGCILETLNNEVASQGLLMPLDLGAKGSCMIGGNVATNAGGLRVIKYGSMHANVLGLEVVLADGTVLDMLRSIRKDNSGYPLKHYFIGAEGTLGVITKVSIALATKPLSSSVLLAKLSSFNQIHTLLKSAKTHLDANLSAFEFMDTNSLRVLGTVFPHLLTKIPPGVLPMDSNGNLLQNQPSSRGIPGDVVVLMESSGSNTELDAIRLETFLTHIINTTADSSMPLVVDAALSMDSSQEAAMWNVRESVSVSLMELCRQNISISNILSHKTNTNDVQKQPHPFKKLYKYDLSISFNQTDEFLSDLKLRFSQLEGVYVLDYNKSNQIEDGNHHCELMFCCFGHVADENLHLNIVATFYVNDQEREKAIQSMQEILNHHVFDLIISKRGSISAEHGIGQQKRAAMKLCRSESELKVMRAIKNALDPNDIMNPGKVLPEA